MVQPQDLQHLSTILNNTVVHEVVTSNNPQFVGEELHGLINYKQLELSILIDNVILASIISISGAFFNVINIVIFYRLGFSDTVNISLFSLAVSDLASLVSVLLKAVFLNPLITQSDSITFDYRDMQEYGAGWPKACFARISTLITAFVTFERCLCIALPLKVKSILTPRRTGLIIISFYVITIASIMPLYYFIEFGPKFYPDRNRTLYGWILSKKATSVEETVFAITNTSQIVSVIAIVVCTVILVVELKRKTAWRMASSSAENNNSTASVRDVKVVKIVIFISTFFIISFFPTVLNIVVIDFFSEYNMYGRYRNMYILVWGILVNVEAINSTINIFIYVNMSSKYASMFYTTFGHLKFLSPPETSSVSKVKE